MPRILSRSQSLYRYRRNSLGTDASQQSMSSTSTLWQAWSGQQLQQQQQPQSQLPASVTSTAGSTCSSSSSLGSPELVQSTKSLSTHSASQPQRGWMAFGEPEDGPWGQFVDPAEAEEEIIRHSKILSKRYSL